MDLKDMGSLVAKLAPSIAASLGGPLAGQAVTALEGVFGIKAEGTIDERKDALGAAFDKATTEQLAAIKKAEQDYAVQMASLGFKNVETLEQIASTDRDSARKREIEVKDNTPKVLAYAVTLGFFGVLVFMMLATVPAASRDILNIMLGTLGTAWTGIVAYYFGSTAGSAQKTKLLAASTPPAA